MGKYTIDDIKYLLSQNNYQELNRIVKDIYNSTDITKSDIEVLEYLSKSSLIDSESRVNIDKIRQQKEIQLVEVGEPVVDKNSNTIQGETIETSEITNANPDYIREIIDSVEPNQINNQVIEQEEMVDKVVEQEETIEENQIGDETEVSEVVETDEVQPYVDNYKVVDEQDESQMGVDSQEFKNKLESKGLTVKEPLYGKGYPCVSLEINNLSKPFIDNLMLRLYDQAKDGICYDLTKIGSTNEELFTIYVKGSSMNSEEIIKATNDMVNSIEEIVDKTDREKNYEELMPDSLKNIKEQFVNDSKDLPNGENYRIGYSHEKGEDVYYLMAGSNNQSIRLTEEMGFKPRAILGNGVVEVDTNNANMENTKIDRDSEFMGDISNDYNSQMNLANQRTNTRDKAKVLVKRNDQAAFLDFKTVVLIIFLIIAVMIAVYLMG